MLEIINLPVLNGEICEGIVWEEMAKKRRDWEESSGRGNTYVVVIYLNIPFTHGILESFGEI